MSNIDSKVIWNCNVIVAARNLEVKDINKKSLGGNSALKDKYVAVLSLSAKSTSQTSIPACQASSIWVFGAIFAKDCCKKD